MSNLSKTLARTVDKLLAMIRIKAFPNMIILNNNFRSSLTRCKIMEEKSDLTQCQLTQFAKWEEHHKGIHHSTSTL